MIIFHQERDQNEAIDNFLDLYFSRHLKYLSSDLLKEGLSAADISKAVRKAMIACKTGGMDIRQHFLPVYTQVDGILFNDCKLSRLGYALILLNADVNVPIVAKLQLSVLNELLE